MKKSRLFLSGAFASAMLLLGPAQAFAGGNVVGFGGYGPGAIGGYGYGYGDYGGYGYGDYGGYGYGYGDYGGYGYGYGYGGYGGGYGHGGHGYFPGAIDRVDVCYDDYLAALNVRFRVKGGGRYGFGGIPVVAVAAGQAVCFDDGKKGGKGYYGDIRYFEDVTCDAALAYRVHGNRWETVIPLGGYDSYICDYDYGHYGEIALYGVALEIGYTSLYLDAAFIPSCYAGWYDAWWD